MVIFNGVSMRVLMRVLMCGVLNLELPVDESMQFPNKMLMIGWVWIAAAVVQNVFDKRFKKRRDERCALPCIALSMQ